MADYADRWRASPNVQVPRADALRTLWLGEAALAPDEYRASWGLSALTPETRDAALAVYGPEQPYVGGIDYFGRGRPVQLPEPDGELLPLGQSFLSQNDRAVLGRDVAAMLARGPSEDPIAAAMQSALSRLGER